VAENIVPAAWVFDEMVDVVRTSSAVPAGRVTGSRTGTAGMAARAGAGDVTVEPGSGAAGIVCAGDRFVCCDEGVGFVQEANTAKAKQTITGRILSYT
jgi:hypothetical protein